MFIKNKLKSFWMWLFGAQCRATCPHDVIYYCQKRYGHFGNHITKSSRTWS